MQKSVRALTVRLKAHGPQSARYTYISGIAGIILVGKIY